MGYSPTKVWPGHSLHLPASPCISLHLPASPCTSLHLPAPPCTSLHLLGRRQAHARLSLAVLRRRAALLAAANTAANTAASTARDAKASRDKEAEAYFSEGKRHNAEGDFWAARQYFSHANPNPNPTPYPYPYP